MNIFFNKSMFGLLKMGTRIVIMFTIKSDKILTNYNHHEKSVLLLTPTATFFRIFVTSNFLK